MATRSYKMVGDHSDPDNFHAYLYSQLKEHKNLHLQAEEQFNELAVRRGNPPQHFEFVVREIYRDAKFLIVQDVETKNWIQVQVDKDIRFDIID